MFLGWWRMTGAVGMVFGYWIKPAWMQRMAAAKTAHSEPAPAQRAKARQRLDGIFRTAWMKPAARANQRADGTLVNAQQKNKYPGGHDGLE